MERSLVFVKPDGMHRRAVGKIIQRFEEKGLKMVGLKLQQLSRELVEAHYGEHREKPFFNGLVDFVLSAPVVLMVWEGPDAISVIRKMVGKTHGGEAAPGTIRGDFGVSNQLNLIHASDGPESAAAEVGRFFRDDELVEWTPVDAGWIHIDVTSQ